MVQQPWVELDVSRTTNNFLTLVILVLGIGGYMGKWLAVSVYSTKFLCVWLIFAYCIKFR